MFVPSVGDAIAVSLVSGMAVAIAIFGNYFLVFRLGRDVGTFVDYFTLATASYIGPWAVLKGKLWGKTAALLLAAVISSALLVFVESVFVDVSRIGLFGLAGRVTFQVALGALILNWGTLKHIWKELLLCTTLGFGWFSLALRFGPEGDYSGVLEYVFFSGSSGFLMGVGMGLVIPFRGCFIPGTPGSNLD